MLGKRTHRYGVDVEKAEVDWDDGKVDEIGWDPYHQTRH